MQQKREFQNSVSQAVRDVPQPSGICWDLEFQASLEWLEHRYKPSRVSTKEFQGEEL
jgi:hypothetical protein